MTEVRDATNCERDVIRNDVEPRVMSLSEVDETIRVAEKSYDRALRKLAD